MRKNRVDWYFVNEMKRKWEKDHPDVLFPMRAYIETSRNIYKVRRKKNAESKSHHNAV